jgi:hypothetical protein
MPAAAGSTTTGKTPICFVAFLTAKQTGMSVRHMEGYGASGAGVY